MLVTSVGVNVNISSVVVVGGLKLEVEVIPTELSVVTVSSSFVVGTKGVSDLISVSKVVDEGFVAASVEIETSASVDESDVSVEVSKVVSGLSRLVVLVESEAVESGMELKEDCSSVAVD